MAKGAIVLNKYYSDDGLRYMQAVLKEKLLHRGITLCDLNLNTEFGFCKDSAKTHKKNKFDFILFFDKDVYLAHWLEGEGIRLINTAATIETCDDKIKTYAAVSDLKLLIPKTISAPLMFDVNDDTDTDFLDHIESQLKYPIVVKENTGSQGRQVYLASDRNELTALYLRLRRTPHHYQEFIADSVGEDIRIYIVGKKAVAAAKRQNTTDFRSNVCMGAKLTVFEPAQKLLDTAEKIAARLNLEYGSVDFIFGRGQDDANGQINGRLNVNNRIDYSNKNNVGEAKHYFIESNSNAYFKTVEGVGINISDMLTDYILKAVYGVCS